jgi:hypothetical protein
MQLSALARPRFPSFTARDSLDETHCLREATPDSRTSQSPITGLMATQSARMQRMMALLGLEKTVPLKLTVYVGLRFMVGCSMVSQLMRLPLASTEVQTCHGCPHC